MAMVKARRGQHEVVVSKNAFESMFKHKGYRIVEEQKSNMEEKFEKQEEQMEEENEVETIPVSEMNKEQLLEFAKEHNIDTSRAKSVREARQIIQKTIRESNM